MKRGGKVPPPTRADARHEAAHAVVSVRMELPLEATSIVRAEAHATLSAIKGVVLKSVGYTNLVSGTVKSWEAALPDPIARQSFEKFAVQGAAGIYAEMSRGSHMFSPEHRDDLEMLVKIASRLGVGNSTDEEAVRNFVDTAVSNAEAVLTQDTGVAWERVTTSLLRKKRLTAQEVRRIVQESDTDSQR
jgi:hypothetical protein